VYRRLIKWLAFQPDDPAELRNAPRIPEPGVVVYYWDGATPSGRQLRDISLTGAYLYTPERWYPGTVVRLLIQPKESDPADAGNPPPGSVSLQARVVWHGPDGMALEFLFHGPADRKILEQLIADSQKGRPSSPASGIGSKSRLAAGEAT
jgi:PilZ domain